MTIEWASSRPTNIKPTGQEIVNLKAAYLFAFRTFNLEKKHASKSINCFGKTQNTPKTKTYYISYQDFNLLPVFFFLKWMASPLVLLIQYDIQLYPYIYEFH